MRLTLPPTVTVPGELNGRGLRRTRLARQGIWTHTSSSGAARTCDACRSGLASPPPPSHGTRRWPSRKPGLYRGSTTRARLLRDALPISGGPERRRRHDDAPRARARLPPPTDEARGELRRRDHPAAGAAAASSRGSSPGLDENRLTGYAGLPINHNPYMDAFRRARRSQPARSRRRPGEYGVVFDSAARAGAGSFRFRYWVNDVTPPALRLRTQRRARGSRTSRSEPSTVDPAIYANSILASIDGELVRATYRDGVVSISSRGARPGEAPPPAACLRLPGDEEHRERRTDPPEHALAHGNLQRALGTAARSCGRAPRSSEARRGRAGRSG